MIVSKPNLPTIPENMLADGRKRTLIAGQPVVDWDEVPTKCCYILEGQVRTYDREEDGRRILTGIYGPGQLVVASYCILGQFVNGLFLAEVDSQVVYFTKEQISDWADRPDVSRYIQRCLAVEILELRKDSENVWRHDTLWRLSNFFYEAVEAFGQLDEGAYAIDINLSQQLLAEILGVNRVTVARLCSILKEEGLVFRRKKRYTVKDKDALKRFRDSIGMVQ